MSAMSSVGNFLNLAYLIEISIVFNLTYKEIKLRSIYQELGKHTKNITENPEIQNIILNCKDSDNLGDQALIKDYSKFDSNLEKFKTLSSKIKTRSNRINYSILWTLIILIFATFYSNYGDIPFVEQNFSLIWYLLFVTLIITIVLPAWYYIEFNIKNNKLTESSDEFVATYKQYQKDNSQKTNL